MGGDKYLISKLEMIIVIKITGTTIKKIIRLYMAGFLASTFSLIVKREVQLFAFYWARQSLSCHFAIE